MSARTCRVCGSDHPLEVRCPNTARGSCCVCGGPLDSGGYCIDLYDGLEMLKAAIEYLNPPVAFVVRSREEFMAMYLTRLTQEDVDRAINQDTLADEISEYLKAEQ